MESVIIVVIVLVVGVLVALKVILRGTQWVEIPVGEYEPKTYKVFTLGARGSGKTCFLAAMHHMLGIYKRDIGFSLDTHNTANRNLLIQTYEKLANPLDKWPEGTADVREWRFTCSVRSPLGKDIPVFHFLYWDYAGGYLTSASVESFDVQRAFDDADAVLVILDGQKILYLLQDGETHLALDERIYSDLNYMLPVLRGSVKKPIHFLITKWDLLDKTYTLEKVREVLLE